MRHSPIGPEGRFFTKLLLNSKSSSVFYIQLQYFLVNTGPFVAYRLEKKNTHGVVEDSLPEEDGAKLRVFRLTECGDKKKGAYEHIQN